MSLSDNYSSESHVYAKLHVFNTLPRAMFLIYSVRPTAQQDAAIRTTTGVLSTVVVGKCLWSRSIDQFSRLDCMYAEMMFVEIFAACFLTSKSWWESLFRERTQRSSTQQALAACTVQNKAQVSVWARNDMATSLVSASPGTHKFLTVTTQRTVSY